MHDKSNPPADEHKGRRGERTVPFSLTPPWPGPDTLVDDPGGPLHETVDTFDPPPSSVMPFRRGESVPPPSAAAAVAREARDLVHQTGAIVLPPSLSLPFVPSPPAMAPPSPPALERPSASVVSSSVPPSSVPPSSVHASSVHASSVPPPSVSVSVPSVPPPSVSAPAHDLPPRSLSDWMRATPTPSPVRPPNPIRDTLTPPPRVDAVAPSTTHSTEPNQAAVPAPRAVSDVTLELCARLTARIDSLPSQRQALLAEERLDDDVWREAFRASSDAIAAAIQRSDSAPMERFDEAYLLALENVRGPIDVSTFEALEVAIERGRVEEAVANLGIPRAAVMRIKRAWTRRLIGNADLHRHLREAIHRERNT